MITSLGGERAGLCAFGLFCMRKFMSFFSSSRCQELAAVCDCGTPCTFLIIVFSFTIDVISESCQ